MAYSEKLAQRVREAIASIPAVEEKKMFGGLAFMINNKMCITVGEERIMCRIDPALYEEAIKKEGCTTVKMGGREYKGFVHVQQESLQTKKALNYWIDLALAYNKSLAGKTHSKKSKK